MTNASEPIGFHVDTVANGEEAVTAACERGYDAIIMDCEMPVMDGYAATREICNRQRDLCPPIVAVSASAMGRDVQRALAAGMDAHISKPIDREVLEMSLARFLPDGSPALAAPESIARRAGFRMPAVLDGAVVDTLLDLDDGDASQQLTERFLRDAALRAEALTAAAAVEDLDGVRTAAHSLRGLSASFGAKHVAELAATIEHAASEHQPLDREDLAAMNAAVTAARDAFASIMVAVGCSSSEDPT